MSDNVGNPLLRKGGSQTLRQTCLCLFNNFGVISRTGGSQGTSHPKKTPNPHRQNTSHSPFTRPQALAFVPVQTLRAAETPTAPLVRRAPLFPLTPSLIANSRLNPSRFKCQQAFIKIRLKGLPSILGQAKVSISCGQLYEKRTSHATPHPNHIAGKKMALATPWPTG